jgi:hypothetical protein
MGWSPEANNFEMDESGCLDLGLQASGKQSCMDECTSTIKTGRLLTMDTSSSDGSSVGSSVGSSGGISIPTMPPTMAPTEGPKLPATTKFVIKGALRITGVTADDFKANENYSISFKKSIASLCETTAEFVLIKSISAVSSRLIRARRLADGVSISYEVGSEDIQAANIAYDKLKGTKKDDGAAFTELFKSEAQKVGIDSSALTVKSDSVMAPADYVLGESTIPGPKEVERGGMSGAEAAGLFFLVCGLLTCIFLGYKAYEKQQNDDPPQRTAASGVGVVGAPPQPGAATNEQTANEARSAAPVGLGDVEPSLRTQVQAKAQAEQRNR